MFKADNQIVGLEIGTSKVCAIIGRMDKDGRLSIAGIGQSVSRGVRKGEIIDKDLAIVDVRNALTEAEEKWDCEIDSLYLGVTGQHIKSMNNKGAHTILSKDKIIRQSDLTAVLRNAQVVSLESGRTIIHSLRQNYFIDGRGGITHPVDLTGSRLEVGVHIIHGQTPRIELPKFIIEKLQLNIDGIVFNGLASSLAVLTEEQMQQGVLLIDFGAGTIEYVVFIDGVVYFSGVIAVGGDHITNDLALGLKISLGQAEQLKIKLCTDARCDNIFDPSNKALLAEIEGLENINIDNVIQIIAARIIETFKIIEKEISRECLLEYLGAGIVLCGGSARIPGIAKLASHVFKLPATLARISSIESIDSRLDKYEFATALGLVKFGAMQKSVSVSNKNPTILKKVLNVFKFGGKNE